MFLLFYFIVFPFLIFISRTRLQWLWVFSLFVFFLLVSVSSAKFSSIPGINYGQVGNNLPSPLKSMELIKSLKAKRIKIYDANPEILKTLSNTNHQVSIMVRPILSPTASRTTRNMNGISSISELEQEELLLKLEVFKIKGKDKHGRKILRIIGKFFPARFVSVDVVRKYLEERIFPKLEKRKFSVLYMHSGVDQGENFPGISALRSIYEAIPMTVKENLEAVYFIHPGLQSRLFLATFGRFLFTPGLYGKLRYVSRLDYLWEHVKRNEVELPEFVYDHDEDLEYLPFMGLWLGERPPCFCLTRFTSFYILHEVHLIEILPSTPC